MTDWKRLSVLALLCLMMPQLTACQTRNTNSSSVVSETAEDAQQIEQAAMCEGTKPDYLNMSDDEYNALPVEVRRAKLADVRAWIAMGCRP